MAEPQQIVSTRRLYCLQSHDLSTRRLQANHDTTTMCNKRGSRAVPKRCAWPPLPQTEHFVTKTRTNFLASSEENHNHCRAENEIITPSSSDFDLRGFQSLSGIWRRPTAGCSAKWLYWRDDQTVPLVLGSIAMMIISYRWQPAVQSGG